MDVEAWLNSSRAGGRHRRQLSTLTLSHNQVGGRTHTPINWWSVFAHIVTFWAPSPLLKCMGYKDKEVRQAFREKIALCFTIVLLCGLLAFFTFGLGPLLCPIRSNISRIYWHELTLRDQQDSTWALGKVYSAEKVSKSLNIPLKEIVGKDISSKLAISDESRCARVWKKRFTGSCNPKQQSCIEREDLRLILEKQSIAFEWKDIEGKQELLVYNGAVIRMPPGTDLFNDPDEEAVLDNERGKDGTRSIKRRSWKGRLMARCLKEYFVVGQVSKQTIGCFLYSVIQIVALILIGSLVLFRFVLAVTFSWFLSRQLDKMEENQIANHKRNISIVSRGQVHKKLLPDVVMHSVMTVLNVENLSDFALDSYIPEDGSSDPHVVMLVTCYSEGEASLRLTLDSLTSTEYHDRRKLLLIIADGLVTGSGNSKTTSEIVKGMMKIDDSMMEAAQPKGYFAIGSGSKRQNRARVYAGQYLCRGRAVSCVLIEKCGTLEEADLPKPGNRGKRDSQLILMNFVQRVIFNDRMTPLDFDLFNKICWAMGVTPDVLDIVLMVDADTKVAVDSLSRMVNAMRRDPSIMGLCGETRIANKRSSWVSAIQVFEYYISHHLGKAFESVFGGVTCLPGCFCMYRIKSVKNGRIVPILASPLVIDEYSQNVVDTLHKKNLLLLGEDRFLTTLMLKLFPKRKMIFVPQAYCKTYVPDEFKVLLSQRRRWINSTIHNLFELVLVPDLCGIFCFSMQFVVVMELIGTLVLPAAIIFTGILVGSVFVNPMQAIIPLALLGMILGLPAILILITTRKIVYLWWMLIYLAALPIWNFILPIYSYWHFDDFSWGETRKIEGEDTDHSEGLLEGDATKSTPMRTWMTWTRLSVEKTLHSQGVVQFQEEEEGEMIQKSNKVEFDDGEDGDGEEV